MSGALVRGRLLAVVAPVLAGAGYDLEEVTVTPAGRRRVVRVVVDRDGGVALDDLAQVSRSLSAALDVTPDVGVASYVLEVTSPGVDRPLREPRHWRRATGRLVAVTVAGRPLLGRVVKTDEAGVTFDENGTPCRASYADLGPGAVRVEFAASGSTDGEPE